MSKNVVFTVQVEVTEKQLKSFISVLNENEVDEDEGEKELTFKEVTGNPKLLEYICTEAVKDGVGMYDPEEFWNSDGWCDWRDYR